MDIIPGIKTYKLSELTGSIERMFQKFYEGRFFWVIADVTDHKYYPNKEHHYLALVEKKEGTNEINSKISAVIWKEGSGQVKEFERRTGQVFRNNINVMVKVKVGYQSAYGLKLTIIDINPEFTIGVLERHKQETLQRLLKEYPADIRKIGEEYFTSNNQLEYNRVIQRIAVVASSSSAGYQDFQHTLDQNNFHYRFHVDKYFTTVQGEASSPEICRMLDEISMQQRGYDAVVIIRGGGAQVDFLVFDHFEICSRIARLPFPVITGIGHQKDETISDMMAKTSTKTPTRAAEFIIAHNRKFEDSILNLRNNMVIKIQTMLFTRNRELSWSNSLIVNKTKDILARKKDEHSRFSRVVINCSREILMNSKTELMAISGQVITIPKILMASKKNDLANAVQSLEGFSKKYFISQKSYLAHYHSICRMMDPKNILDKGFAIIYQENKIVASADKIRMNEEIRIRMSDVTILAKTISKNKIDGKGTDL